MTLMILMMLTMINLLRLLLLFLWAMPMTRALLLLPRSSSKVLREKSLLRLRKAQVWAKYVALLQPG
tara:strand:+ start:604 stop:804 length:201 start_codon:yes stop_codon:yes gene_type:complete